LLLFIVFFSLNTQVLSEQVSRNTLVAVYVVKLSENIEWPTGVQSRAFRIQVIDENKKVYDELAEIAQAAKFRGRRIEVFYSSDINIMDNVDVVYLGQDFSEKIDITLPLIGNSSTLLISDGAVNERLVMINLNPENGSQQRLTFEINKANIINQNLSISPDIILLGGTEIDVAQLYKEGQLSLVEQQRSMAKLKLEQNSLRELLNEKRVESSTLQREVTNLKKAYTKQKKLYQQEQDKLSALSNEVSEQTDLITNQQLQLSNQSEQLSMRQQQYDEVLSLITAKEAELKLQDQKVNERSKLIEKQDREIAEHRQILTEQSKTITEQKYVIVLAALSALLLGGMAIFSYRNYLSKQRSNAKLKVLTEQLRESQHKAESASHSKSVFLANMSHELRTPLNAILGFSQLLEKSPPEPEKLKADLKTINRSGEHLLHIINDILDMSKIEAGAVKIEEKTFDLGSVLVELVDMMRIRAEAKGLVLSLDQTSEFPRVVRGDSGKIRQILINLLGNAIKFTEQGKVSLSLDAEQTTEKDTTILKFRVADSGPGIPEDMQESIFKPFEQVENRPTNNTGQKGTGLGMTITKQFVELMNGQVYLESELDKGTTFHVDIPIKVGGEVQQEIMEQSHNIKSVKASYLPLKVLIVEDQAESALLLERIIQSIGIDVKVAENGLKAVEIFQTWQPTFIWMDRRMPVMDGLQATKQIRRLPNGQEVKIAALTASALNEEKESLLSQGFDEFLVKPYKVEVIYQTMKSLLGIEYEYEDDIQTKEVGESIGSELIDINPSQIAELDSETRHDIYLAILNLNSDGVIARAKAIESSHPQLAKGVIKLASKFRFEQLLDLFGGQHD